MYYRQSTAALVVYDITNESSFGVASSWVNELLKAEENVIIAVVGNKADLADQRQVSTESAVQFVQTLRDKGKAAFAIECSALTGDGVKEVFEELGYRTDSKVIDVSQYGVPQKRRRFILVAMRNSDPSEVFAHLEGNKNNFCREKGIRQSTTIRDAIGDLEEANGTCQSPDTKRFQAGFYGRADSGYQRLMRQGLRNHQGAVDSHRFVNHSAAVIKLHNDLLQNAPKGKRITPKDGLIENLKRRGVTVLDANSQAPTITSIPDELVHYEEPRILTVREQARIQSFPDWFEFKGKYTSGGKLRKKEVPRYTQVGNAVPPLFAEQVGRALMEVMNG